MFFNNVLTHKVSRTCFFTLKYVPKFFGLFLFPKNVVATIYEQMIFRKIFQQTFQEFAALWLMTKINSAKEVIQKFQSNFRNSVNFSSTGIIIFPTIMPTFYFKWKTFFPFDLASLKKSLIRHRFNQQKA